MTSTPSRLLSFIERFEQNPIIQDIRNRYEFNASVVIETDEEFDVYSARDYAFSSEMKGRVRPEANKQNGLVRWFFERPEDGILFALRFATKLPRAIE